MHERHGLHVVPDPSPLTQGPGEPPPPGVRHRPPHLRVRHESVELRVSGDLTADTAGCLRAFLSMFTSGGGPHLLVLDVAEVSRVDGDGVQPLWEARDLLLLRSARLRLRNAPAALTQQLAATRPDAHPEDDGRWTTGPLEQGEDRLPPR
jgi:anti-anti-sigma regulatory factor